MNRKTWFLISVISLQIITCRLPVFKSRWTQSPVIINGQITGQDSIAWYPIESSKASLGLANNNTDLFLLLKINYPMYTLKSNKIVLLFARQEKEDIMIELHYSGMSMVTEASEPKESFWLCLNEDQRKHFLDEKKKLDNMITVIKNGLSTKIPPDGTQGFAAGGINQQDFYGYEFKIPIQGNEKLSGLDLVPGESCYIGIEFSIYNEDRRPVMTSQIPGVTEGRGIMQDPSMQGRGGLWRKEKSVKDSEIWFQVILATGK